MTLQQFLDKLAETGAKWRAGWFRRGRIRDGMGRCPIEVLVGRRNAYSGGDLLGLKFELTLAIIDSADRQGNYYDSKLRARLLKACGL